ncbi:MAG: ParB/RepB/Spo0J family partition protein [Oscillospiraceae bacterium]|nr:ParB/RepB/Spo0J family partition protein [Oscillospiraceae bacterium]
MKHKGLGKGLDALFIDNQTAESAVSTLKISQIEPNRHQPRRMFDEASLMELADSIRLHGILQPLVVRPLTGGGYQIVAGERRWRACRMAGKTEVPVIIRELDDPQTLEIAIIENLQREDLSVIELAGGYKALMENFNMTQEQVAEKVGKSRPVIANTIRLLNLPGPVIEFVRGNKITQGHAKALLAIEDEKLLIETAEKAAKGEMLVRDIEKLARREKAPAPEKQKKSAYTAPGDSSSWGKHSYHRETELALMAELGRKVVIQSNSNKTTITIDIFDNDDLADIAARLARNS